MAVARVYGGGGVPDPVTLVTAVYGNRHRSPGDVAVLCALKSETPRPRWRFSRRARARAPVPANRRRGCDTHVHVVYSDDVQRTATAFAAAVRRPVPRYGVTVEVR